MASIFNVRFYVSDHGFGHAVRSANAIAALLQCWGDRSRFTVVSGTAQARIMQHLCPDRRVTWRVHAMDLGLPLAARGDTVSSTLASEVATWCGGWDRWIARERTAIEAPVDLFITDISPLPILLAQELGATVVGISNFTWYDQYRGFVPAPDLAAIRAAYKGMRALLEYPLAMDMSWLTIPRIPLKTLGRPIDREHVRSLRANRAQRSAIVVSFGKAYSPGRIDLPGLKADTLLYVNAGLEVRTPARVQMLTETAALPDFIAASDLVISKAGWGIVSESVAASVPILAVDRKINEDQATLTTLERLGKGRRIRWDDLRYIDESTLYNAAASYNSARYEPAGVSIAEALGQIGCMP